MTFIYGFLELLSDLSEIFDGIFLSQLKDFIKIPSISSNPSNNQDIQNCAKFVYDDLKRIGFTHVEIIETKKHPIVYGEIVCGSVVISASVDTNQVVA